jgi:hypothetical protein
MMMNQILNTHFRMSIIYLYEFGFFSRSMISISSIDIIFNIYIKSSLFIDYIEFEFNSYQLSMEIINQIMIFFRDSKIKVKIEIWVNPLLKGSVLLNILDISRYKSSIISGSFKRSIRSYSANANRSRYNH